MDTVVTLAWPGGEEALSHDDLIALAVPDAAQRAGRWGAGMASVPFGSVVERASLQGVSYATFLASDGYSVSMPFDQAVREGVVVVPPLAAERTGVRLVVGDAASACVNVKAVRRIELGDRPGRHTVDPNPHDAARVPGWD